MKHTFKYILIGLSLLAVSLTTNAQMQYNTVGGVTTGKQVTGPVVKNGVAVYTVKLETYAVGESDVQDKASDIVLVLDVSGSMKEPYIPTESKSWTADDIRNSDIDLYYREWNSTQGWFDYYGPLYVTTAGNIWNPRTVIRGEMVAGGSGTKTLEVPYTGVLYHDVKLDAMKEAVIGFIDIVNKNDKYKADGVTPRNTRLGNRIAIVTFSENYSNVAGLTKLGNNNGAVTNDQGYTYLINSVNSITANGSTNVHLGMNRAQTILNGATGVKTVVMFTDGIPGNGSWSGTGTSTANRAINYSNNIKGTDGSNATVWTIGVFEEMSESDRANTDNYMSRVSSNYVNVTNMTASATPVADKYYIPAAAGSGSSLSQIFADIASASTSHESVDSNTQVKDVISSSFALPQGVSADNSITVYTMDYKSDGSGWENQAIPSGVTPVITSIQKLSETGQPVIDDNNQPVMLDAVQVEGFDYSKDDSYPGAADGNWVGPRTVQGVTTYGGKKLVIEFDIVPVDGVTGGAGTNTNTAQSGVYIKKPDGTYENINEFVVPHTTLPITLRITKTGLRHGESATFEIERCRPKNWVESASLEQNLANMEYNGLGKPVPSKSDNEEWENWTKVIVTNTGANGDPVVKTLVALDPYYIYKIAEDTWSWAYDAISTTGQNKENTSTVEVNPFKFRNVPKTGNLPKHAEAVTINHFAPTSTGNPDVKNYTSSKDQFKPNQQ